MSRACTTLLALLPSAGCAVAAPAEVQAEAPDAQVESRSSLGARGFVGGVFSDGEGRAGGGGGLFLAFAVVPERWELEGGLSLVGAAQVGLLGVFEVVAKHVFERRGKWSPHLLLGPAFSLDFREDAAPSGGALFGAGITHWLRPRVGVVSDASYRLLFGSETEQVLALALGLTVRL